MVYLTIRLLFLNILCIRAGLVLCSSQNAISLEPKEQLAKLEDFKIEARVTTFRCEKLKRKPIHAVEVIEHHSNKLQQRHFIYKRRTETGEQEYEYFSINSASQLLEVSRTNWTCRRRSSRDMFSKTLLADLTDEKNFDFLSGLFSSNSNEKLEPNLVKPPDHLTGLARLLALIDLNRDKLKSLNVNLYVHDQLTELYKLDVSIEVETGKLEQLQFHAYFGTNKQIVIGQSNFPLRIEVVYNSKADIMLDFFSIGPIQRESIEPENHDYKLDSFTIDPRFGCAQVLGIERSISSMESLRMASMHFQAVDLLARRADSRGALYDRQFVAYDGRRRVFRRDVLQPDGRFTTTIHDLKKEHKFNIRRGNRGGCVVARTTAGLYEPLLPFIGFTFLGTGLVRGLKVDIYEHQSCGHLPALFYAQSTYVNLDGMHAVKDNEQYEDLVEGHANGHFKTLSVVYYFAQQQTSAAKASNLGPLVRVDVYLANSGQLLSRVNVFDFVWELQQAPNGDRRHELFSLPDDCLGEPHLELTMQLDFETKHNTFFKAEQLQEIFVNEPRLRDESLMTTMVIQAGLAATHMSHFRTNSHLVHDDAKKTMQVFVATNLLQTSRHIDLEFYQPASVGYVSTREEAPHPSKAANFEECFFEAAHERKNGPVLFAFRRGFCYIDTKPIYEFIENTGRLSYSYSNIFDIHRGVMNSKHSKSNMTAKEIIVEKLITTSKFGSIANKLKGKYLIMSIPMQNAEGGVRTETAMFEVTDVELRDRNLLARGDSSELQLLEGLTLARGRTIQSNGDLITTNEHFEHCHSACLVDFDCWSFSVCVRETGMQCITSGLDLHSDSALDTIAKEKANLKKVNGATFFNDELGFENRCRTYTKKPLELFAHTMRQYVTLEGKSMSYVNDLDECAHNCVAINDIKLIRETSRDSFASKIQKWCTKFSYVPLSEVQTKIEHSQYSKLLQSLKVFDTKQVGGFCVIPKQDKETSKVSLDYSDDQDLIRVRARTFEFNFGYLYEVKQDISMNEYTISEAESSVGTVINRRKMIEASNADECARACFMQIGEMVPGCKSFDFVQLHSSTLVLKEVLTNPDNELSSQKEYWQKQFTTAKFCSLNSMTLADAKASGYYEKVVQPVKPNAEDGAVVWHYEPRGAYSLDSPLTEIDYALSSTDDNGALRIRELSIPNRSNKGSFLMTFMVLMVAFVSGYLLALKSSKQVVKLMPKQSSRRESTINLDSISNFNEGYT